MPFVSVKCPSCGGDIQLDDSRESGFCVYCGAKVMYKEAVQRIEGNVTVEGIAGLEKLLANAETFHKLKDIEKEREVLTKITQEYPEDWRGWWMRCLLFVYTITPDEIKARLDDRLSCRVTIGFFASENAGKRGFDTKLIDYVFALAPSENVPEIKNEIRSWLESEIKFYSLFLTNLHEDVEDALKQKGEDERVHIIADGCHQRAHQIIEKDSHRMFSKHLIFDDVIKQELTAAGLSPEYYKDTRIRQLRLAWGMDEIGHMMHHEIIYDEDDVYCCLRMFEKVEKNLKAAIEDKRELLKQYCG
jgi:DNA-directed RNA polymerase subunit RPC12/RpoP